jgi:hypothetical protein
MDKMFCPQRWIGVPGDFVRYDVYPWVKNLPKDKKIFCAFWFGWQEDFNLPSGFDYYLITFHIENVNIKWLEKQRHLVNGKFIVLFSGNVYDYVLENTQFISYFTWHQDIEKMLGWHGIQNLNPIKKFKYSAICNRISQSKIWITTKLLETAAAQSLIILNNYIEQKNVHHWQKTNNDILDNLTDVYLKKYKNITLSDGFNQMTDNVQKINSNPWQPQYTESALHFTNGSFHYSYTLESKKEYIYPGPDIDEKTLKCLVAGIPFVACGQFEIYKTLSNLGLSFDYGFDLSWDLDAGNLSRFQSIIALIDYLNIMTIDDICNLTNNSTMHNLEFIVKKGFYNTCERHNSDSLEKMFDGFL